MYCHNGKHLNSLRIQWSGYRWNAIYWRRQNYCCMYYTAATMQNSVSCRICRSWLELVLVGKTIIAQGIWAIVDPVLKAFAGFSMAASAPAGLEGKLLAEIYLSLTRSIMMKRCCLNRGLWMEKLLRGNCPLRCCAVISKGGHRHKQTGI